MAAVFFGKTSRITIGHSDNRYTATVATWWSRRLFRQPCSRRRRDVRLISAQLATPHEWTGRVKQTLLHGEVVFDDADGIGEIARSELL